VLAVCAGAAALGGEPAPDKGKGALGVEISLAAKDLAFPEFMEALRKAIPSLSTPTQRPFAATVPYAPERYTVSLVTRRTKPLPQVLRLPRKEFEKKLEEYNRLLETEGFASWMVKDKAVLYSLETKKPMSVGDVLEVAAALTNLALVVEGEKIKLVRFTELPLDVDALATDLGLDKTGEAPPGTGKPGNGPPGGGADGAALAKTLAALKAHPQRDADRARLLCTMAEQLKKFCWQGMSPRAQGAIVAAAREVLAIQPSLAARQPEPPAGAQKAKDEPAYDFLLLAAGGLSDDYEEAVRLTGAAARMHVDTCCDAYYDTYFHVLSGARHLGEVKFPELLVKEAETEVAYRRRGLGDKPEQYEKWVNTPNKKAVCPICGVPKDLHTADSHMPGLGTAYYRLGQAYRAAGRHADAIAPLKKALAFDPVNGGASNRVALGGQDPHKIHNPGSPDDARLGIFNAMIGGGKTDEAIDYLRNELAEYRGTNPSKLRMPLFDLLKKQNRQKEVVDILREALAAKPDDTETFTDLVGVLRRGGDIPGAMAACEEFAKKNPQNKTPGMLLEQLRRDKPQQGNGPEKF